MFPGPLHDSQKGRVLNGKWTLGDSVGVGGMATVYAATGPDGQRVAVKLMHPEQSRNSQLRRRFVREADILGRVSHPGAVALHECRETPENDLYIAMELLEGESVQAVWHREGKRLEPRLALGIVAQALDALQAFHDHGVMHRDFKPPNLFLRSDGVVKLIDFGIAHDRKSRADLTLQGQALGTPAYMSPEQAAGRLDLLDPRSDVFSAGATLYTLLSGRRLHEAATDQQSFVLAATSQAPSLARVAPDLGLDVIKAVDKACAWDPDDRYQSAAEMREALLRLLADPTESASVPAITAMEEIRATIMATGAAANQAADASEGAGKRSAERIREVMRELERAIGTIRRYGASHPQVAARLDALLRAVDHALEREPRGLTWNVLPHVFEREGEVLWEPQGWAQEIPYNLFASGFRALSILPGIDREQLVHLVHWFSLDPVRDLGPEDDLGTILWELELRQVEYRLVTSLSVGSMLDDVELDDVDDLEGDARERVDAQIELAESMAAVGREGVLEAKAVTASLRAVPAGVAGDSEAVPPEVLVMLRQQLSQNQGTVAARFGRVLADALADGKRVGDAQLVLGPLPDLGERYLDEDLFFELGELYESAMSQMTSTAARTELTRSLFSRASVERFMAAERLPTASLPRLRLLLESLSAEHFDVVLEALLAHPEGAIAEALLPYLQRFASDNELRMGAAARAVERRGALALLRLLAGLPGERAKRALRMAAGNPDPSVKLTALRLSGAGDSESAKAIDELLDCEELDVRLQTLAWLAESRVRRGLPTLVRRAAARELHARETVEKRATLDALFAIDRDAGVEAAIALSRGTVIPDKAKLGTRLVALEALGRFGSSAEALEAVEAACKRGIFNSREVIELATAQLGAIRERVEARGDA
jgi:tRNA A-37 threonylcarbamoyl transferase component Bud32